MAMAPKKKYEYFDKGRGIPEKEDSMEDGPSPQQPNNLTDLNTAYEESLSGSSTGKSSPFQRDDWDERNMSPSTNFNSARRGSYEVYRSPFEDFSSRSLMSSSVYSPLTDNIIAHTIKPTTSNQKRDGDYHCMPNTHGIRAIPGCSTSAANSQDIIRVSGLGLGSRDEKKGKRTRRQECRMCANHGEHQDVKGHKWYCQYRDCKCKDCDITRKSQFYMKERQKLTRHQQQLHEDRTCGMIPLNDMIEIPPRKTANNMDPMDFPRREELREETKDILDENLFEQINQACRPRANFKR